MIRDMEPQDFGAVKAIHAAVGAEFYAMPELGDPRCLVRKVVTDSEGRVIGAAVARLEAEVYLLLDPELGPERKHQVQTMLQVVGEAQAWEKGLDHLVCWIPEGIERRFRKRLARLGWQRGQDGWRSWSITKARPQ